MGEDIYGMLIAIRVDRNKSCILDTPYGEYSCKFDNNLKYSFKDAIGHIVRISGDLSSDSRINTRIINAHNLNLASAIPLNTIQYRGSCYPICPPLEVEVEYDEESDVYIFSNYEFDLLATGADISSGMKEIEDEIHFILREYVEDKLENLSKSGLKLRDQLIERIPGIIV